MNRQIRGMLVALSSGAVAMLLYMPLSNSCLLNFDRSVKPVQLAGPDENPYGLLACDNFHPLVPGWLTALLFPALLCTIGAIAARFAVQRRVVIGGVTSAAAMLLAFIAGSFIYPWMAAYWMSARDLLSVVPIAFLFGAAGGWLSTKKA